MMKRDERELAFIKRVLDYNPKTGLFHWKIITHGHGGMIYPGDVAGADKDGYTSIIFTDPNGKKLRWRSNRLAWFFMTGKRPAKGMDIAHLDGDRGNNRWKNLAEQTRTKNTQNLKDGLRSDNVSGHRGVSLKTHRSGTTCWHARITVNGEKILLGDYAEIEDAIAARQRAERKYFQPNRS
jgi:hypothetical protein